jgi:hypothetical protein
VAETSIEVTSEILPYSAKYPAKYLILFLDKFSIYHIKIGKPGSKALTKYQPRNILNTNSYRLFI